MKEFENRSIFAEVMVNSRVAHSVQRVRLTVNHMGSCVVRSEDRARSQLVISRQS